MSELLIAAISVFSIGIGIFYFLFGFTPSISDIYYYLEAIKKGLGWIFTIWIWSIALLIAPVAFEILKDVDYQFLAFFASGGLAFVGAAPQFKNEMEGRVHFSAAIVCASAATAIGFLLGYWYIIIPIVSLCVYAYKKTKKQDTTYWLEIAAFSCYFIVLSLNI